MSEDLVLEDFNVLIGRTMGSLPAHAAVSQLCAAYRQMGEGDRASFFVALMGAYAVAAGRVALHAEREAA